MNVYWIVKDEMRTVDLSGTGAFRLGGRWNSKGTYMLYVSENSSLAYLESLVHFDRFLMPPHLYIMHLEITDKVPVYEVPNALYPTDWLTPGLLQCREMGDQWMRQQQYLAIKIKSAVNTFEYNYLLNPIYPNFRDLVTVISVKEIEIDDRLFPEVRADFK